MGFVHLHCHSCYSLLDSICKIEEMVERAKELGQQALAITDHGVMYGAVDFFKAAKNAGIKPIIGCEVYVAPRSRSMKTHGIDDANHHLVLLCENETGYKNLCYLVSQAFLTGLYYKPRVDKELLKDHHEGLVALSACMSGEIARLLLEDKYQEAKETAQWYSDTFGPDHYYLEMQDHGIPEQLSINRGVRRLASETGLPMVITNDAHYVRKEDAPIQELALCIGTQKTLQEEHMRFSTEEFYLKSEEEMRALFPNDSDAFSNTVKVAEMCNFEFEFGNYHLPAFHPPIEMDNDSYFEKLCWDGFKKRYPKGTEADKEQLRYEISVIKKMGYVNYFLIVADYINYAKSHEVPVGPGRGSAAGSMVTYCLEITDVDPLQYSLYFERFLNPERVSMPDIDIDFCINKRQSVIDYVSTKYGEDRVAQIVTFSTMKARGAIKDTARVLGMDYGKSSAIAKLIPDDPKATIKLALDTNPELASLYKSDEEVRNVIDTALKIEGLPRTPSTHAAGVVIASAPVYEFAPLSKNDDVTVIQYSMTTVEEIGLLKMDFLGLRNLTVMDECEALVRKQDPDFRLSNAPLNDPDVMAMLAKGSTAGVFQMESPGMTGVCMSLMPHSIEDLTAIIALYRPGPMDSIPTFVGNKKQPDKITYLTPLLEPILNVTYGCIVYQEQVIDIFRKLGGYSLGQADNIRRAISKKKHAVIEKEREYFIHGDPSRNIPGAVANGVSEKAANTIYDDIISFASYAFNKSHAVCYAMISYQTAYLKCHYPVAYMAALMSSVVDKTEKLVDYIDSCKMAGIELLGPDINKSGAHFSVEGNAIRFPLAAIAGVSTSSVQKILSHKSDTYSDFESCVIGLCEAGADKTAIEGLIKSGSLDCFGLHRSQMLDTYKDILSDAKKTTKKNIVGQICLFDTSETPTSRRYPDIEEYPKLELLRMERETLGVYLSGHPCDGYMRYRTPKDSTIREIQEIKSPTPGKKYSKTVSCIAVISDIKAKLSKKGNLMADVILEDPTGQIKALEFTDSYINNKDYQEKGMLVHVTGSWTIKDDESGTLFINSVQAIDSFVVYDTDALYLLIPDGCEDAIDTLLPESNVGTTHVWYCKKDKNGKSYRFRPGRDKAISVETLKQIIQVIGGENVVLRNADGSKEVRFGTLV